MSFVAQLHSYGYYDEPILSEAWYVIDDPSVSDDERSVEELFRTIAVEFARQYGDRLDPSILHDFNWGDFITDIPNDFLAQYGVQQINMDAAVVVHTEHDEHILDDYLNSLE